MYSALAHNWPYRNCERGGYGHILAGADAAQTHVCRSSSVLCILSVLCASLRGISTTAREPVGIPPACPGASFFLEREQTFAEVELPAHFIGISFLFVDRSLLIKLCLPRYSSMANHYVRLLSIFSPALFERVLLADAYFSIQFFNFRLYYFWIAETVTSLYLPCSILRTLTICEIKALNEIRFCHVRTWNRKMFNKVNDELIYCCVMNLKN